MLDWRLCRDKLGQVGMLGSLASVHVARQPRVPLSLTGPHATRRATMGDDSGSNLSVSDDDDASSVASGWTSASAFSWRADYDSQLPGGKHRVPIAEMGNYARTLADKEVLRDPLTDDGLPPEAHAPVFGSPYATRASRSKARSSRGMPLVDEAMINPEAPVDDASRKKQSVRAWVFIARDSLARVLCGSTSV